MINKTIIFVHIRKTAGITLRSLFKGQLSVDSYFKEKFPQHLKNLSTEKRKKIRFVSGHYPYGLHQLLPQDCVYMTLLRNPADRIISLYKHLLRKGEGMTFRELINSEKNNQVLMIGENLNEAKKRLNEFIVVGTTERFDETIVVLKTKIGLKKMYYCKKENVGKNKIKIDENDLNYHKEINKDDYEIYKYANTLLNKAIKEYGWRFKIDLFLYKFTNRFLLKWYKKFQKFFLKFNSILREK